MKKEKLFVLSLLIFMAAYAHTFYIIGVSTSFDRYILRSLTGNT